MAEPDIFRAADAEARALARRLIDQARWGALAVLAEGAPVVSRVAVGTVPAGWAPEGAPLSLVSGLALHTRALRADPRAGLLLGEPGPMGDPLTHPRLSLSAEARFVEAGGADHAALRAHWLADHPKAALYIDLPDFRFVVFAPLSALLNGGFGRATRLAAADLTPPVPPSAPGR